MLKSNEATFTTEVILFWGSDVLDGARGGGADNVTQPVVDSTFDTIQRCVRGEDGDSLSCTEKQRLLEGVCKGKR